MNRGKKGHSRLVPREALLASILDYSRDAIISKSLDGTILSWNAGAERIFGYAAAEAVGSPINMIIPGNLLEEEEEILRRLRRGECVQDLETTRRRKDGSLIEVCVTSTPVRNASGQVTGAAKLVRDITATRAHQRALTQGRARLAGIVESAMDAIITVDDDGVIVLFNEAAAAMFACPASAAQGIRLERFIPERFRNLHAGWMRSFGAGRASPRRMGSPAEIWVLRSDGLELPVSASISHVEVEGHKLYTVIMRDLSELKESQQMRRGLEEQLREAQKMEAIGTLAGGIAHDFNNIVGSIIGNVGLARASLEAGHAVCPLLDQVDAAAARARSVVRQILSFSRHQATSLVDQPLGPLIEEAVALLRATLPAIARLQLHPARSSIFVRGDSTQIHQVLINLCTNAWHALHGSSGQIEVGLDTCSFDTGGALRCGLARAGEYAHIWVRDNGSGMDQATRERIFQPFFTTKPRGEGTGLGLAVVHGIVGDHGGAITVDSALGKGSTFHVYLPVRPALAAGAASSSTGQAAFEAHGERVVYIDDDEVMLLMVDRLLNRLGFEARCFQHASEALEAIRSKPESVDVVVTDFTMPECSGLDVARELRRVAPAMPVIISSGYISEELQAGANALGIQALVEKEQTYELLPAMIIRVLDGHRSIGDR